MKSVERELEQLRETLDALAHYLRVTPPHIWDASTCRGVAQVMEGLAERSALLDAGAPPEFAAQTVRELVREIIVEMDDRAVGEALKQLTFEAVLGGHDLSEWQEMEDGHLLLSCRRCGQEVRVKSLEIQNDLTPVCSNFVADG
jgi:hypothetical protein